MNTNSKDDDDLQLLSELWKLRYERRKTNVCSATQDQLVSQGFDDASCEPLDQNDTPTLRFTTQPFLLSRLSQKSKKVKIVQAVSAIILIALLAVFTRQHLRKPFKPNIITDNFVIGHDAFNTEIWLDEDSVVHVKTYKNKQLMQIDTHQYLEVK